jgi:fatty-acyl-CoA synthase
VEGDGIQVLRDLLLTQADSSPDRLAFAHRDRRLSFGELAERAERRARSLQGQGIGRADRVAVTMSAGLDLVETFWALQLVGAVPCIVNPGLPDGTLNRRIELLRPRAVLKDGWVEEAGAGSGSLSDVPTEPDDIAFLQLTSGTSGEPRASMILHRNALGYLSSCRFKAALSASDVMVSWVPPWHDLGLVRFIIEAVSVGASCHIVEPAIRTIPEWLVTISAVRGTFTAMPDFAARLAVRMVGREKVDLSSLRFAGIGAEPVRWSTIERFEATFGTPKVVTPAYGLGEATLAISAHLPGEEIAVDEHGNVSCGLVIPDLEVEAGRPGAPEEIRVRGPGVFAGYFDAPDDTAETLRDGWLHTGDLGYFDDSGRLFVLGRRAGMIKRAGSVVAPRELEEAAERVPGVRIAMATTISTAEGAEIIVVAIEAGDEAPAGVEGRVSRQIVDAVGFAPARVVALPRRTIPRTDNGKLRYGALRELLEAGGQS